jgi:flagellar hook-basal body complex protein FliE
MSIAPIGPIGPVATPTPVTGVSGPSGTGSTGGGDFASAMSNGLDQLQQLQSTSDNLAVQAATGSLTDVSQYMVASTQASLATQLTVAIRNKAVDAFNEIMRMQA